MFRENIVYMVIMDINTTTGIVFRILQVAHVNMWTCVEDDLHYFYISFPKLFRNLV